MTEGEARERLTRIISAKDFEAGMMIPIEGGPPVVFMQGAGEEFRCPPIVAATIADTLEIALGAGETLVSDLRQAAKLAEISAMEMEKGTVQ